MGEAVHQRNWDLWCSLECTPACQAGGRGFKSRQVRGRIAQLVERAPEKCEVAGSTPAPTIVEGGPVMDTNGADGLTITPIWWQPSGGRYVFPSVYEHLLDQYVHDIAAASGSTDNVFSVLTEYYQTVDGLKKYLTYKFTAATPIVDTAAFPANGCRPAPGNSACVTDGQLRAELREVTVSHKLPTTMAYYYPLFFPPG